MNVLALIEHNGVWYVLEQVDGRGRLYQLETRPPKVTWNDYPDGETPVIDVTPSDPRKTH